MRSSLFKNNVNCKLFTYRYVNKQDSVLNKPQGLLCHKTQPNQANTRVNGGVIKWMEKFCTSIITTFVPIDVFKSTNDKFLQLFGHLINSVQSQL